MTDRSEPNAQNSELNPKVHPSGARIEKMIEKADAARREKDQSRMEGENATRYISPEEPAEGERIDPLKARHRMDADHREDR